MSADDVLFIGAVAAVVFRNYGPAAFLAALSLIVAMFS